MPRSPSTGLSGEVQGVAARTAAWSPRTVVRSTVRRAELQIEIKGIQRALGATGVFVTHDQQEALQVADQIAVLHRGRIEQFGPPGTLCDGPAAAFIAGVPVKRSCAPLHPRRA